jgi:hypothetical protein
LSRSLIATSADRVGPAGGITGYAIRPVSIRFLYSHLLVRIAVPVNLTPLHASVSASLYLVVALSVMQRVVPWHCLFIISIYRNLSRWSEPSFFNFLVPSAESVKPKPLPEKRIKEAIPSAPATQASRRSLPPPSAVPVTEGGGDLRFRSGL